MTLEAYIHFVITDLKQCFLKREELARQLVFSCRRHHCLLLSLAYMKERKKTNCAKYIRNLTSGKMTPFPTLN